MEDSSALEVIDVEPGQYVPSLAITPDQALANYRAFQEFRSKVLQVGHDYATIPGTDKPTLLKPGAEKLATAFAFAVEFLLSHKVEDWDAGFFHFDYECRLTHRPTGTLVATCHGSANSKEARYRWRSLPVWKASEEDKARAVRTEQRRKRDGGSFTVYIVENDDPYTLVNTLQKMAQKRAFVGAVLIATNASDSFTQDVEDMAGQLEDEGRASGPGRGSRPQAGPAKTFLDDPENVAGVKRWLTKRGVPERLQDLSIGSWRRQGLDRESVWICAKAVLAGMEGHVPSESEASADEEPEPEAEPSSSDGEGAEEAPEPESVDWEAIKARIMKRKLPVAFRDSFIALAKAQGWSQERVLSEMLSWGKRYQAEPDQTLADLSDMARDASTPLAEQVPAVAESEDVPF